VEVISAPLVFQCRACRAIVGDSFAWMCSNRDLNAITLTGAWPCDAVCDAGCVIGSGAGGGQLLPRAWWWWKSWRRPPRATILAGLRDRGGGGGGFESWPSAHPCGHAPG
jgi:hypothetical protein